MKQTNNTKNTAAVLNLFGFLPFKLKQIHVVTLNKQLNKFTSSDQFNQQLSSISSLCIELKPASVWYEWISQLEIFKLHIFLIYWAFVLLIKIKLRKFNAQLVLKICWFNSQNTYEILNTCQNTWYENCWESWGKMIQYFTWKIIKIVTL